MKKIILLVIALSAISSNAQKFTVFYKEIRKANYQSLRSSEWLAERYGGKEVGDLIRDRAQTNENELLMYEYTSILRIDGKKSIHYPEREITNDTINNFIEFGEQGLNFTSREVSEKKYTVIHINLRSKKKVSTDRYSGKDYLISEKLEKLDWKILNEEKTIGRYKCKKAILKHAHDDTEIKTDDHEHIHVTEVWFTEEIKTAHGPLGYWGLPGLVLEVKHGSTHVLLDKIVYDIGDFVVQPPTAGEEISRGGFNNLPILEFIEN